MDCPLFLVFKNFNCLRSDCKYFIDSKCEYDAVRKIVYDKLVNDRLIRIKAESKSI